MPKRKVLAAAVAIALSAPVFESYAQSISPTTLPTGGRVVAGQATIGQSGASMQIVQGSTKAALDWSSFSIGSQAAVTFSQPSASAIALNRVLGNNASEIYGRLSANGQVFLLNPNGVLFARGSQVDVGGIVASTLSMSSDDFMAGRYRLTGSNMAGTVINQGDIKGRSVVLVGPHVANDGTIEAQSGTISLVGAGAATLDYMADGLVQIRVDQGAVQAEVANNGLLRADGGTVTLTAKSLDSLARSVVNNTGVIEARTVESVDGVVRLGGVKLLADEVNVTGNARIDASGERGGGEILIGGNAHGAGPESNALTTQVGSDVAINADATTVGNGGKVIVWSNETTRMHGSISARGGLQSGDGGFIETSGHSLDVSGMRVNASAANGRAGQLLLDPGSVTIDHSGTSGPFNPTGATATIGDGFINTTLNGGTDVTITTSNGTGGTGDITVNGTADAGGAAAISNASGGARTLTLLADRDINIHTGAFIGGSSFSHSLAVVLNSNRSDTGGAINIAGSTINTFGGGIQLVGGSSGSGFAKSRADGFGGVWLSGGSNLDAASGAVLIKGEGFGGANDYGVVVVDSSVNAGTMGVYSTGHLAVLSTGSAAGQLISAGLQTVDVSKTIFVQGADGGTSKFGQISSSGGQTIDANAIVILAGGNTGGGGFNTGNFAQIANQSTSVGQSVTVDSGGIALTGGGGASPITDNFAGLFSAYTQNITLNNGGSIALQGGSSGGTAGTVGQHGSRAFIGTGGPTSPSQYINFASGGSITITGGTNGTRNFATINAGSGTQTIVGSPTILLIGGSSGGITNEENFASINAVSGLQDITSGSMTITGGGSGSLVNYAGVNAANQTIVINGHLLIQGDASGPARIGGATNTSLDLTVHGNTTLSGGTVSAAGARIGSNGAGGNIHIIDMTVDGNLTLNGGTGQAWIGTPSSNPGNGNISITMTGVSGPGNILVNSQTASASIRTLGTIDIDTAGALTVAAGSGASASAVVGAPTVDIHAGTLTITGGSGAANNNGAISSCVLTGTNVCIGGTIDIHVAGNTVLTGGSSTSSAGFIGVGGTGDQNSATVTFVGGGDLTLNGGSGSQAAAAIGAGGNQTNANVSVDIQAANVILNDSSSTLARIGHSSTAPGPGNVVVTATAGNISLNSNFSSGTAIRTLDNVTLHADASGGSISEGANSFIVANSLTTTSSAGTNLAGTGNAVTGFSASNTTSGNISLTNAASTFGIDSIIQSGTGSVSVTNTGPITTLGFISTASGNITLAATSDQTINSNIVSSGPGSITLTGATISVGDASIQATGTGNVTLANPGAGGQPNGVLIDAGSVMADSGTISITGYGQLNANPSSGSRSGGVFLTNGAVVHTNTGAINITGTGGSYVSGLDGGMHGIVLRSPGTEVSTVDGAITMTGFGGTLSNTTSLADARAIRIEAGLIQATGTGSVTLDGHGGTLAGTNFLGLNGGVQLQPSGTISSFNGNITLTGGGGASNQSEPLSGNRGLSISGTIHSTGGGSIVLTGNGGTSTTSDGSIGVFLTSGPNIQTANGSVTITGTGGTTSAPGGANVGVSIESANTITAGGSGNLTITGTSGSSADATRHAAVKMASLDSPINISTTNGALTITGNGDVQIYDAVNGGPAVSLVSSVGNINISSIGGAIQLNSLSGTGAEIFTTGSVGLHADSSGGTITQGQDSFISSNGLVTSSHSGTTLDGLLNSVTSFAATNTVSGGISLSNGGPLSLSSITNSASGGTITVSNAGDITVNGNVSGLSNIALLANSGDIVGGAGRVSTTGGAAASIALSGNNIGSAVAPVLTDAGNGTLVLDADPSVGSVYISNNSAGGLFGPGGTQISTSLSAISDSHTFSLKQTSGNIQIADEGILFDQGGGTGQTGTLILDASVGSIVYRGDLPGTLGGPLVHARNVIFHAAGDIGTSTSRMLVNAETLTARSDSGNVFLETNPNRSFISTSPGTAMVQRVYANTTLQDQAGFSNGAPAGTYDVIAGTGALNTAGSITAQNVTFTADKMALSGPINATGTVILQPATASAAIDIGSTSDAQPNTLELSAFELGTVTAGTLQVGRIDSTGNLNFSQQIQSGDVKAATFRLIGNNITAAGSGGIGFNFDHNVEMWGNNDVGPGTLTLADGRNLTIIADRDNNHIGNVLFSGTVNVGTTAANTGSMTVSGENINFFSNATVFSNTIVNGTGSQTFAARNQINIDNQADGGINITAGTGLQTFSTVAGGMTMTAGIGTAGPGSGLTTINAGGNQTLSIAGGLSMKSRAGSSANADAGMSASGNQTINAQYVELIANGLGDAGIFMNAGTGSQSVTTTGANAFGAGVYIEAAASASSAYLQTGATGGQTINVNGPGNDLKIIGTGGSARIANFPNAPQIVNVSDVLLVGGAGTAGGSVLQASGAQTITANGIQVIGGSGNTPTNIQTSGNQTVTAGSGGISITAGSNAGGASPASINQFGASGTQIVTVNGGNVSVLGGTVSPNNIANISNSGTAQTVTVNNAASVVVAAQTGGAGINSTGNQTVTIQGAGANALTVGSPTSASNSNVSGSNQVVTVGAAGQSGSITILGGAAAGKSSAISNITGTQTVSTTGTISMTGGTATGTGSTCTPAQSGSCANIGSQGTGLQTVTANAINAQGGSGGVSNGAGIFVNAGPQQLNIGAGGLQLTGGGGVSDNFSTLGGSGANGQTLTINVAGNTVLTGGTSTNSTAFIGLGGTGSNGTVTVNLNGTGNLTLNAGSGSQAAASIGAGGNQANATATVTIGAADITLNDSSTTIARIGHSSTNNGPGNIVVNATGNLALNGASGQGTAIRTTGNVTLHADSSGKSISEAANSIVSANSLTATANAGLNLPGTANAVSTFNATNAASGNVSLTNTLPLTVTGISQAGAGSVTVSNNGPSNTGTIAITGPITSISGGVSLIANAAITESGGGLIGTSGLLSTSSLGGQALNGANAIGSFNASDSSNGNIALSNSSASLAVTGAQAGNLSIANTGALTLNGNVNSTLAMTLSGSNVTVQDAFVNAAGAMNVTTGGTLSVLASNNAAVLQASGTQTISASRIVMQGAPSGSFRHAFIQGGAGQNITVGAGGMQLTGGGGSNNNVEIWQVGSANDQVITVNGGGAVVLTGGSGTQGGVQITNFGKAQSLTFTSGGSINLQGGSGAGGMNNATIENTGSGATTQTITFTGGGAINMTGGTVGTDNYTEISADFGNQIINGNPDITMLGGASGGGPNAGNGANLNLGKTSVGTTQTINAHNISMTGGSGGVENNVGISAQANSQSTIINATGSVTLAGGAGSDALAVIGSDQGNTTITVNATGPITLTSGSGATTTFGPVAAIGAPGGFSANVTVTSGGTVSLNGPLAEIGAIQNGPATVSITGTNIALGSGRVRVTTPLTLVANGGQITQTTGTIEAPSLVAKTLNNAGGAILLGSTTNTATSVNLQARNAADSANAGGTITYGVASGIDLANLSTAGNTSIAAAGDIANSGALSVGGNANFNAGSGNITLGGAAPVNFGSLTFVGNAVSINEGSSTQLAGASSASSLALISAGAITNAVGASLSVLTNASFTGTSIDLGNQSGDLFNFGTLTYNSPGAVSISEDSAMSITGTNTAGSLVLSALGAINETGTSQTVAGDASFTGTSITFVDQSGDLLSVGGNATLTATSGGAIALTQGTANFGTVAVNTTGSVTLVESSATTLASVNAGSLALTSSGNVTQTGPIAVTGTTNLQAGTNTISLGSTSNSFVGTVTATGGGGITLATLGTLTPGTIDAGVNTVSLTASTIAAGGPVTASSATLSSSTAVSGLQLAVTDTLTLTGTATNWTLTGPIVPTTVVAPPTTLGTFNSAIIGNPVSNPAVQTAVTAGQAAVQTATQSTSTSTTSSTTTGTSSTVAPATVSFSTSLTAPTSSPITIAPVASAAPTTTSSAPTTTSSAPTSTSAAPSDTSSSTTSSTTTTSQPSSTSSTSTTTDTSSSSSAQTASTSSSSSAAPESSSSSSSSSTQTASTSSSSSSTTTAAEPSSSSSSSTTSSSTSSPSSSSTSGGEAQGTGTTQTASTSRSSGETSQGESSSGSQPSQSRSSGTSSGSRQTASTSRTGASASRAMTPLMAAMADLHAQKAKALESAVNILEKNPAAADLKGCGGAQLAGNCIASRPVEPQRRSVATPTQAALPAIERKVALLIGIGDYRGAVPKLNSPIKDINEIGKIYREQFGYEVRTLPNADKATIIREFNRLILETGANDSVTVFYAGHGQLVEKTGRGYWIPARASADDPSQWISNQDIGRALENIPARQVLLVSDSCYSGSLTRDAKVQKDEVLADPAQVLTRRSVTVLSSGGEEPVADAGKDGHSVFAWHFMQSLKNVQGWEKGVDVYGKLTADVQKDFPQEPQYGEAIGSGHQRGGDFLFEVRKY